MRILVVVTLFAVALGGVAIAVQQEYPNVSSITVLDNRTAVVQRLRSEGGKWAGEHTHPGNQMAIFLDTITMTYKEDGKEFDKEYRAGDVIWIDKVTHDHKSDVDQTAILITLK
jgi:quercetin dioxygenase-like cupin family protein